MGSSGLPVSMPTPSPWFSSRRCQLSGPFLGELVWGSVGCGPAAAPGAGPGLGLLTSGRQSPGRAQRGPCPGPQSRDWRSCCACLKGADGAGAHELLERHRNLEGTSRCVRSLRPGPAGLAHKALTSRGWRATDPGRAPERLFRAWALNWPLLLAARRGCRRTCPAAPRLVRVIGPVCREAPLACWALQPVASQLPAFVNKVLLEHGPAVCSHIVFGGCEWL